MATKPPARPTPKFKTGDLVKLKSGSPVMTVSTVHVDVLPDKPIDVYTSWFAGAKRQRGNFLEDTLELVPNAE